VTRDQPTDEIALRSELARVLEPSAFPASIESLRAFARRNHATDVVVDLLDRAHRDRPVFNTVEEVWDSVRR
jgi:hypothetical protein